MTEQLTEIFNSLSNFIPETLLVVSFFGIVIIELILYKTTEIRQVRESLYWLSLILLGVIFYWILDQQNIDNQYLFGKMLLLDGLAMFIKGIVLLSAMVMVLHAYLLKKPFSGEYFIIVIGMTLGLCLMAMSVNLLMIYLSIEVVSISSYLLAAFNQSRKSTESALKYVLFGAVSSAVMLYGMSWLYGITGTLNINEATFTRLLFQEDGINLAVLIACLFTLGGFLFKLASVPFHLWTPDAYEGTPTPIVSFFSIAPKIAALAVAIRFLTVAPTQLQSIIAVISMASITVGNFSALWQQNAKRLLAYSTIAQAGFMLIGLVVLSPLAIKATLFYASTYLFISMLAFLLIDICLGEDAKMNQLKGLGRQQPFLGIMMILAMIALTGLPLTVGFTAKFIIFSSLWEQYQQNNQPILLWLFTFGLLNTAVALFYYLKMPYLMFFKETGNEENIVVTPSFGQKILIVSLAIPIVWLFFQPSGLMNWIEKLLGA